MPNVGRIAGLLWSMLALGCSQQHVDLGGLGTGGSAASMSWVTIPAAPRARSNGGSSAATPSVISLPSATAAAPLPQLPSALQHVGTRVELTPPIAGGTLAVAADGGIVVIADPDRDAVYLASPADGQVRTVQLPRGSEPGRVVLDDAGAAHVVLRSAGRLARIALDSGASTLSSQLCEQPRGLGFAPAARALFLACADGDLVQLSPDTLAERARVHLERDLRDVLTDARGPRFVSRYRSAELLQLDAASAVLQRGRPPSLPRPALGEPLSPNSAVGATRVSSTSANLAYRAVPAADGGAWLLHQRAQDDIVDSPLGYQGSLCGPVVQAGLTRFDAQGQPADNLQLHGPAALAVDLALSSDDHWLAVALPSVFVQGLPTAALYPTESLSLLGGRLASSIDPTSDFEQLRELHCAPPEPIALSRDAQAVALAFDRAGLLYIQNRVPARLDIVQPIPQRESSTGIDTARLVRSIPLQDGVVRDLGHELFYASVTSNGLCCASCHADGQDDGHVWPTPSAGPRRTQSLRGGLLETAPFHWDGALASFEAEANRTRTERMHGAALPAEGVNALGQWLEKLPALRLSATDTSAAESGKQLFESSQLGCVDCHSGPALTNNQSVDVGTGGPFQVPALRGLALRAPYMHDGCARQLDGLFEPACGGAQHGHTAQLSAAERRALIVYLETL